MTKMVDFYRNQKVGEGKRNPYAREVKIIAVVVEESREEPQVLTQ